MCPVLCVRPRSGLYQLQEFIQVTHAFSSNGTTLLAIIFSFSARLYATFPKNHTLLERFDRHSPLFTGTGHVATNARTR